MADQLERRFEGVDHATMPDLWGAIEVRAQRPAPAPRGPRVAALVLALIVAAAVIGGLVWALQGRESQPAVEPGVNGDIGYVGMGTGATGGSDVFAVDPATGIQSNLTHTPDAAERGAVWSPDGGSVVFERSGHASGAPPKQSLVVRAPDGSEQVLRSCVAPTSGCLPQEGNYAWSPDGTRLVWDASDPDGREVVQVFDLATGEITDLCTQAECGPGMSQFTWSPDGRSVAFSNASHALSLPATSRTSRIWVQRADGSAPAVPLTGPANGCATAAHCLDVAPSWSPNGDELAFIRVDLQASGPEVDTIRPDGSGLRSLSECPAVGCTGQFPPVWSPDGASIAVAIDLAPSAHRYGGAIRVVDAETGHAADLPACKGCVVSMLAWSPDGSSLTFIGVNPKTYRSGVYVMREDGADLRQVPTATGLLPSGLAWLPAGAVPSVSPGG
jgi:Tol biopolymer transport system component